VAKSLLTSSIVDEMQRRRAAYEAIGTGSDAPPPTTHDRVIRAVCVTTVCVALPLGLVYALVRASTRRASDR
jgi:hypothetical protein